MISATVGRCRNGSLWPRPSRSVPPGPRWTLAQRVREELKTEERAMVGRTVDSRKKHRRSGWRFAHGGALGGRAPGSNPSACVTVVSSFPASLRIRGIVRGDGLARNAKEVRRVSKKTKRAAGAPKTGPVWHMSAEEATLAKKPRYNGYACGHGAHGDAKYDRAKAKRAWKHSMEREGALRGPFLLAGPATFRRSLSPSVVFVRNPRCPIASGVRLPYTIKVAFLPDASPPRTTCMVSQHRA